MLKKHQVKRQIKRLISERSDLRYVATVGDESFLRVGREGRKAPRFKFLRLFFNKRKRILEISSGVGFFPSVTALKLAPSFVAWKECDIGLVYAHSKKSSRQALKNVLHKFKPELHGNYSLLHASFEDSPIHRLYKDFTKQQQGLAANEPDTIAFFKREASPEHFAEISQLAQHDVECELNDEQLESLLDSLTAEGEYTNTSSFSLNKEKALQKMADFQLGERHLFPLFMASGLSLLGATELDITIDSDEIWINFQGVTIDQRTLELLTTLVLSGERDTQSVGYEKLAQALLQSAGHEPTALEFQFGERSIDLREFPRLELDPKQPFQTDSGVFYTKLPASLQVAKRFFKSLTEGHSEVEELQESLRLLPTSWTLNSEPQVFVLHPAKGSLIFQWFTEGLVLPRLDLKESFHVETHESPLPAQLLFMLEPESEPKMTVILDGIAVENPPIDFELKYSVYLWMTNMSTDLSGRKLVQNQLLEEILGTVSDLQNEATQSLQSVFGSLSEAQTLFWQPEILRKIAASEDPDTFRRIPIVQRVAARGLYLLSETNIADPPLYTTDFFERGLRDDEKVTLLQEGSVDDFQRLFRHSRDATSRLRSAKRYYEHYEQWLTRPTEQLALSFADPKLIMAINGHQGEIAFSEKAEPPVRLLCQARTLPIDCSHWLPNNVELYLNDNDLEMNDAWNSIKNRELLDTLRAKVHSALERLIDRLARQPMTQEVTRHRMKTALAFLKRSGRSISRWQDVTFIQETRTVMNRSGPIPRPERITEYFCLRERPNAV